jgi:16S rRNA (adenine1518-N6/adenine1519-N6)-dimethyltransferase
VSYVDPRTVLRRYDLRPKKSFGQNFLVSPPMVEKIAALCVPRLPARVVEIGAGLGTLTAAILALGAEVIAIERDRDLVPVLRSELESELARGALQIVEADAATVDLSTLLSPFDGARVLAGNLPYQITGRLLERAVTLAQQVDRVVVMVQREVADRLAAAAGADAYGQLSVFTQAAFEVRRAFVVSSGCFHPRPAVDSAVVVLTPLAVPRAQETETFREVVHAAFRARRKTLRNAIAALVGSGGERKAAVEATGIDLTRRGETLTVEELAAIAHALDQAT